jgi:hypothetical protein
MGMTIYKLVQTCSPYPRALTQNMIHCKVDISLAPLAIVLDMIVWQRLQRFFVGGALERTWNSERKSGKDKDKKKDKVR